MRSGLAGALSRLEDAVARLPGSASTPAELFDLYEQIAIQTLDSEYMNFDDTVLERYFRAFLEMKRLELGLDP